MRYTLGTVMYKVKKFLFMNLLEYIFENMSFEYPSNLVSNQPAYVFSNFESCEHYEILWASFNHMVYITYLVTPIILHIQAL